jgi:hypothetical protein
MTIEIPPPSAASTTTTTPERTPPSAFTTGSKQEIVDFAKAPTVRASNFWLVAVSRRSPRHFSAAASSRILTLT